jgi:hypothetical protein
MNLWQMLCFCGFLASDGIPQQLLKDYIEKILPEDEQEIHETFFEMLLHVLFVKIVLVNIVNLILVLDIFILKMLSELIFRL